MRSKVTSTLTLTALLSALATSFWIALVIQSTPINATDFPCPCHDGCTPPSACCLETQPKGEEPGASESVSETATIGPHPIFTGSLCFQYFEFARNRNKGYAAICDEDGSFNGGFCDDLIAGFIQEWKGTNFVLGYYNNQTCAVKYYEYVAPTANDGWLRDADENEIFYPDTGKYFQAGETKELTMEDKPGENLLRSPPGELNSPLRLLNIDGRDNFRTYTVYRCRSCDPGNACLWYEEDVTNWHVTYKASAPLASCPNIDCDDFTDGGSTGAIDSNTDAEYCNDLLSWSCSETTANDHYNDGANWRLWVP